MFFVYLFGKSIDHFTPCVHFHFTMFLYQFIFVQTCYATISIVYPLLPFLQFISIPADMSFYRDFLIALS